LNRRGSEEERWEEFKRKMSSYIEYMVAQPQRSAEISSLSHLQENLAGAFMIEIIQEENPHTRKDIERGITKRAKVFVDIAYDAEAYDKWKKEEEVSHGIAHSMMFESVPPNFIEMNEEERSKYFEENWGRLRRDWRGCAVEQDIPDPRSKSY